MADIKTHLRELSVIYGILTICKGQQPNISSISPKQFYDACESGVYNDIFVAKNILTLNSFDLEHKQILENGCKLALLMLQKLPPIKNFSRIIWSGYDTQKDNPYDIKIDNYRFSLKEDSYILENMGLYKYINLLTNSSLKRGLHVFKAFSPAEYKAWFNLTWNKLLQNGHSKWIAKANGKYTSEIIIQSNAVTLNFNNEEISTIPNKTNLTVDEFISCTTSITREKVFSKWISENLKNDSQYINVKSECSETAGRNLTHYVNCKLNPINIARFLQIYNDEYYYAKTTPYETKLFKVPNITNFNNIFRVSNIEYDVPSSQLNIYTTITNIKTGKQLILRNENRFSHGQFNGTPESKMYYERGNDLSIIYEEI